jgi:hypothetical protein
MYRVWIELNQFREYLVEADGPWGDDYFQKTFGPYVEEDCIWIEYKYGEYKNGKSLVKWRIPDTEKVYCVRYGGSSCFAMWWCGLTDHLEDEEEEEEDD